VVVVAAAAGSAEEHHCLWNQLPLLPPPERLLNAPPVAALEEVGEVATVLEEENTLDPAVKLHHFQHSQILKETLPHLFLEVHHPWIYLGEEVVGLVGEEAEGEAWRIQLGKEVVGVEVSLVPNGEQVVGEVQARVTAMASHSPLLRTPRLKEVAEVVEGEAGVGLLNPDRAPSHHLGRRYPTTEFEAR
jgi:hypothetical protein